jgi:hypothetical protein
MVLFVTISYMETASICRGWDWCMVKCAGGWLWDNFPVVKVVTVVSLLIAIKLGWKKIKQVGEETKIGTEMTRLRPLLSAYPEKYMSAPKSENPKNQHIVNEAYRRLIEERVRMTPNQKYRA